MKIAQTTSIVGSILDWGCEESDIESSTDEIAFLVGYPVTTKANEKWLCHEKLETDQKSTLACNECLERGHQEETGRIIFWRRQR